MKPSSAAISNWLLDVANSPYESSTVPLRTILRLMALYSQDEPSYEAFERFLVAENPAHLSWILSYGGAGARWLALVITPVRHHVPLPIAEQAHEILHEDPDNP